MGLKRRKKELKEDKHDKKQRKVKRPRRSRCRGVVQERESGKKGTGRRTLAFRKDTPAEPVSIRVRGLITRLSSFLIFLPPWKAPTLRRSRFARSQRFVFCSSAGTEFFLPASPTLANRPSNELIYVLVLCRPRAARVRAAQRRLDRRQSFAYHNSPPCPRPRLYLSPRDRLSLSVSIFIH